MTDLPQEWREAPLAEVCQYVRGVTYGKSDASDKAKEGFLPLLRATNIAEGRLSLTDFVYVPSEKVKPVQLLRGGDLVMAASSGSIQVVGKSAPAPDGFVGTFGAFCAVLRPNYETNHQYLNYFISSPKVREAWSAAARGTNINNLKREPVLGTAIPLPPLDEQQRIVEILEEQLSRLDAALASIRTVREKAAAFRRSLLHSILQGADENALPDGWVRTTLGEVTRVSAGRTPNRFESRLAASVRPNREVPFYKVGDMNDAPQFMNTARVHFAEDEAGEFGIEILPSGSVVFPKAGGAIATNKKRIIQTPGAVDLNCMAVTASEAVDERFIYWFFESFDLTSLSDGSILPQIGKKKVTATSIAFPKSRVEQSAVVTAIETEMTRLQNALRVTDQLEARIASERRSLLHAAFSGTLTAQWRETHHG